MTNLDSLSRQTQLKTNGRPIVFRGQGFSQRPNSVSVLPAVFSAHARPGRILHGRSIVSGEPKLHVVDEAERGRRVRRANVVVVLFDYFSGKSVAIGGFDDIDQLFFRSRHVVYLRLFQDANRFGRVERPRGRVRLRLTCVVLEAFEKKKESVVIQSDQTVVDRRGARVARVAAR